MTLINYAWVTLGTTRIPISFRDVFKHNVGTNSNRSFHKGKYRGQSYIGFAELDVTD